MQLSDWFKLLQENTSSGLYEISHVDQATWFALIDWFFEDEQASPKMDILKKVIPVINTSQPNDIYLFVTKSPKNDEEYHNEISFDDGAILVGHNIKKSLYDFIRIEKIFVTMPKA